MKVYAVGVGPGSPKYVTEIVKEIIQNCDVVIGYKYTLKTIEDLIAGKEVYEITMNDQEASYQKILPELGERTLVIPFTGDVNFSESEVVDRLIEIFGEVEIVPGISSIQVAASRAKVPLDKSKVITMHVTTPIEDKKLELQKALIDGFSVVLVPRPWPKQPDKHFMPSEIAIYLRKHNFETDKMKVHVFEAITTENETCFEGTVKDLEGKEFSDLSVMVFNQVNLDSYMNYRWQWEN
ncbi:precorrin-6y C5,15-methyltransferase (decarboxylating) subunit CbiE [Candidatus Nitrosopumilus sediminis]|uniref:Precorrin-6y C5,15-methyltransferase subunit CbiE n=1 Tax=Candidatus Nitrosopumilus sediminis TaxID=1229909 RepID=K0BF93_9ARCH|nr:precorrin-6y C5,15-methyltransferase (decarboxylating) subunit CbiE [Candidatus Nitrosopumilus sediminis]AFS83720.1 precorrin-6y C5,15-methyltransferase subunit CbiE [Candidatus Nitrosopumilus sediminis]